MEREQIEALKKQVAPIMECNRRFWGKEVYDAHVVDILTHFDMLNEETKEIFQLDDG